MTTLILKKCRKCGVESTNSNTYKRNRICKECKIKYSIEYKKKYPIKAKKIAKKRRSKFIDILDNQYLGNLLRSKTGIKINNIPDEIFQIKRLQLTLHRLIKEKTLQQNVDQI